MTTSFTPRRPAPGAALFLAASVLAMAGCGREQSPAQTQKDMNEERRAGNAQVQDAQREAAEHRMDAAEQATEDQMRIEIEQIRADHAVATARCDGLPEASREGCRKDAQATYDQRLEQARKRPVPAPDAAAPPVPAPR